MTTSLQQSSTSALAPPLDWNIASDADIRPGSIELQRIVHREWHDKMVTRPPDGWLKQKPLWRVRCVDKLEILLGRPLYGKVLEIGAGTALCSTFISQRETVERVTALDYDHFCVDTMMPTTFEKFGAVTDKIERVYGSYNGIPRDEFYDFIVAVGALHHSENLVVSLASLYRALRPGGIALISDVCERDSLSNAALNARYEALDPNGVTRYGRAVANKDNGDHWYRLAEWLSASWAAGFEAMPFLFDHVRGQPANDEIFRSPSPYDSFSVRVHQPYFAKNNFYDTLMLVLQRPDADGAAAAVLRDG